ncbi:MAG: gephyrin-like molybdotransferase Glp [Terrimesophilobacter sp.]
MATSTEKPSTHTSSTHTAGTVSVAEHLDRILSAVSALPAVTRPLGEALGLTLAVEVVALVDVPSFDNSAMDGYAVLHADAATASADSPVSLRVVADLPAGASEDPTLQPGEAARIMTGAPLPDSADCVVPVEDTDQHGGANTDGGSGTVQIFAAPKPTAHIRHIGTDARAGEVVLRAGICLNARDLSAAAATGSHELTVIPAPRVAVLSTGSELCKPGEPLARGQIHDSNSLLIASLVTECGGIPVLVGSVPDDDDALRAAFGKNAPHVDAFITSGGVSVGAFDVVKAVLAPVGVWFGSVRMQPGKPQGFGQWPSAADASDCTATSGTPIFALPGNPVSVFVSFEQFVRPALMKMQGRDDVYRPALKAAAATSWRSPVGRAQFMPAVVETLPDGRVTVRPASEGGSGSYLVASLAGANALAAVPESVTEVREGDLLDVTLVP